MVDYTRLVFKCWLRPLLLVTRGEVSAKRKSIRVLPIIPIIIIKTGHPRQANDASNISLIETPNNNGIE